MSDIADLTRFIKFWFGHDSLKSEEIQTPHSFQICCLATPYQAKILKVQNKSKEMAFLPEFFAANEEDIIKSLVAENRRGYDMFFFTNAVRQGFAGKSPTNEDMERRLFFPIDFDYRLPFSLDDIQAELGLQFAAITISSQREHKHHQAFIALDWLTVSEEDRLDTTTLARRICRAFGSDNVGDMRRIMRLPGLINWKTAELEPKKGKRSDTELVDLWLGREYEFEEIEAAVEKFERSEMSEQLRALRVTPVREGGTAQGERGEFGRWDKVLEAARAGVATVSSGGRHNALASWGCQMSSARLPWSVVDDNLDLLAQFGVSPDYKRDEPDDFARLRADLKKKWSSIDAELDAAADGLAGEIDAAMSVEFQEPWCDEETPAAKSKAIITSDNPITASATVEVTAPAPVGGAAHLHIEFSADHVRSPHIEKVVFTGTESRLDFGPAPRGPGSLIEFAQQVAKRLADEREEHWLGWLGEALNGANHFDSSDIGSISGLCSALQRRLAFVGALRNGNILGPVVSSDEKHAWSMTILTEPEARLVVRHLLFTASGLLLSKETRRKVGELPEVASAQKMKKKPRTVFAAKGELLTQVEREMMLRLEGKVQTVEGRQVPRGLAGQNGVLDLEKWQTIRDAADPWDDISHRLAECFVVNKESKPGVLDPRVSWVSHQQCAGCSFSIIRGKYSNGHG